MTNAPPPSYDGLTDTPHTPLPVPLPAHSPLGQLTTRVEAIEELAAQARGVMRVLILLGGLFTAACTGGFAWVWSLNAAMASHDAAIERNAERLEEHRRRGGPQGHPESVLEHTSQNRERIRAVEQRLDRMDRALDAMDDKLDEVLERLPRRGR